MLEQLKHVPVESVIPIISTVSPTVIITPLKSDSRTAVRTAAYAIAGTLHIAPTLWLERPVGKNFGLTLRLDKTCTIELATTIPSVESAKGIL